MLNITYALKDEAIANRLKEDLMGTRTLRLEHPMLVVIASNASLTDEAVKKAIQQAKKDGHHVGVLSVDGVSVPANMGELPAINIQKYDLKKIVAYLNRVDLGAKRLNVNRRLLFFFGAAGLIMFFMAVWGVSSGSVVFPVGEYQTENALNEQRIEEFARPTLEAWMPRTTQDAIAFPATVEAAPTRLLVYLLQTATSIPLNAEATQNAIGTAAVATSIALTATATP